MRSASERLRRAVTSWPNDGALEEASALVEALCGHERVLAVVAFGSAVRPVTSSFDLDLLFIYEDAKPDLVCDVGSVDLRGYARSQVEDLLARGHDLLCWSIRFGRVICERDRLWTTLVERWADRLPLPSAADAEIRARKALEIFVNTLDVGDVDAALEQYITYLTHIARAALIRRGVYPASRPELPAQLLSACRRDLAGELSSALHHRAARVAGVDRRALQYLNSAARNIGRFQAA